MKLTEIQRTLANILLGVERSATHLPESKVEPGEKVLGTIEDPITRSLYSFARRVGEYADDYLAANQPRTREELEATSEEERHRRSNHFAVIRALQLAVQSILLARLAEQFPEAVRDTVDYEIRAGWQVAVWKRPAEPEAPAGSHTVYLPVSILEQVVEAARNRSKQEGKAAAGAEKTPAGEPAPATA